MKTTPIEEINSMAGQDLPMLTRQPSSGAFNEKRGEKNARTEMHDENVNERVKE